MDAHLLKWCVIAIVWFGHGATGSAQPADPQATFNQSVEHAKNGDYEKAVELCRTVLEQLPAAERGRVHKLLGYAHMKLGWFPEAWHHLTVYLESADARDTSAGGWLQEVEAQLKETHVKVSFTCSPAKLTVELPASAPVPAPPVSFHVERSLFVWWFVPGKHTVRAEAPGYDTRKIQVDVRVRGDSGVRELGLLASEPVRAVAKAEPAPVNSDSPLVSSQPRAREPSRAVEWAFIGSGFALGLAGGVFHGLGYTKNEDLHEKYLDGGNSSSPEEAKKLYDDAFVEEVRPRQYAAYALYGLGGAALLAGLVTWTVRDSRSDAVSPPLTFLPVSLPGGAGALMTLEF